ncbi:hypothetical protein IJ847_01140 [Candidatus Saccharibacteria bacterium]|nr:hypothetical protein [Candidatus Saccharibacteria bacterium]
MGAQFASYPDGSKMPTETIERAISLYRAQKNRIFWQRYGMLQCFLALSCIIAVIAIVFSSVKIMEIIAFVAFVVTCELVLIYANHEPLRKLTKRQFRYQTETIREINQDDGRLIFLTKSGKEINARDSLLEDVTEFQPDVQCAIIMLANKDLTMQEGSFTPIIIKTN